MSRKSPKERKIFLSNLNSWFSNFFIEEFRTDYLPDARIQNKIMGTLNATNQPLPKLFNPIETQIEIGYNYNQEVFQNDYFIYFLDDANLAEIDFIIRGFKKLKFENEKTLILVSNIMTWANTPLKIKSKEEIERNDLNEVECFSQDEEEEKEEEEKKEEEKKIDIEDNNNESNIIDRNTSKRNTLKRNTLKKNTLKKNETISKNDSIKEDNLENENKENENLENKENENLENKENENLENKLNLNLNVSETISQKENNENENKERIFYYKDSDYNLRIPNQKYRKYKIIESKALSITNPNIKVYIICPGFIYGCGENFFFEIFRDIYLGKKIPLFGEGKNSIPTIHIIDLIKIIKRVIEKKPYIKYIFAVDKTKNPSLNNILKSISKAIGDGKINKLNKFNVNEVYMENYINFKIDVKILPSKFYLDERKQDEDIEDFNKRKFKWHCEFGIPENLDLIRNEFNLYRGLKPVKIIVIGPPNSGKSFLCKKLYEKLNLPSLNISNCIEEAKNKNDSLGEEIRNKFIEINENLEKVIEEYEKKKAKKKNEPPLDITEYNKLPNELLIKIIKNKLNSNECIGRGYIFENFPKSYNDCFELYYNEIEKKIEKKKEENEEEKEEEIIKEKILKNEILPDSVILISNYKEETLKENLQKITDYEEKKEEIDNRFERRLKKYKENNENENSEMKNLINYYLENNIEIYNYNYELSYEEQIEKLNEYLNRKGPINIYERLTEDNEIIPFIIEEEEKEKKEDEEEDKELKKLLEEHSEENHNLEDENISEKNDENKVKNIEDILKNSSEEISIKSLTEDKSNNNNNENEENKMKVIEDSYEIQLRKDKEREIQLLEKKTEILRNFLNSNVIPILSKGILNICQTLPKDPVESLCDYLTKINYGKDFDFNNNNNNIINDKNEFSNLLKSDENSKIEEEKKEEDKKDKDKDKDKDKKISKSPNKKQKKKKEPSLKKNDEQKKPKRSVFENKLKFNLHDE